MDDAACPRRLTPSARGSDAARATAAGARILSIGIAVDGRLHVRVLRGRVATSSTRATTGAISLLWSVLFVIDLGDLPAGRAAAVAHDRRRAGRAACTSHPLRTPATIQAGFAAAVPRRRAGAARADRATTRSTAPRRCTGSSSARCSPTRRATSPAAGSPGTSGSASTAGSCCSSRSSRFCFPVAVAVGHRARADRGGAGHRGGAVRVAARRPVGDRAGRRRASASRREARRASRRRASPSPSPAIQLAEQTLLNAACSPSTPTPTTPLARRRLQRAADRARAAAALPGGPDLAAPPPRRARGDRGRRRSTARSASRSSRSRASPARCALGLLADRPVGRWTSLFGDDYDYGRVGLAAVAVGMGFHLAAGTLNQAALAARPRGAGRRAPGWSPPRSSSSGCCSPSSTTAGARRGRLPSRLRRARALRRLARGALLQPATRRPAPRSTSSFARRAAPAGPRRQHAGDAAQDQQDDQAADRDRQLEVVDRPADQRAPGRRPSTAPRMPPISAVITAS